MNQKQIASLYRQVSARGATPVGLVIKLYDAIIEDLRRARESILAGDVEGRINSLNHALLIIAELESVLDFERGGHVATQLRGFYQVMRGMILEANIHVNGEKLDKLTELFSPLRQAWEQVEREVANAKPTLTADSGALPQEPSRREPASQRQSVAAGTDADDSHSNWSA